MKIISLKLAAFLTIFSAALLSAQSTNSQNVGLPPNGSFDGTGIESVQVNNGNLHIEIPLFTLPGRGLNVAVSYAYDSKGWWGKTSLDGPSSIMAAQDRYNEASTQQWRVKAPLSTGSGIKMQLVGSCTFPNNFVQYTYLEPGGTSHPFPKYCSSSPPSLLYSVDASAVRLQLGTSPKAIRTDGVSTYTSGSLDVMEDTNGNKITQTHSAPGSITDTLGRTIQTDFTKDQLGNYDLSYYDANGSLQTITVKKSNVTIQTALCTFWDTGNGCTEYATHTWSMPTEIDLPNGMIYVIKYDNNTYGMPSEIDLPTGAKISTPGGVDPPAFFTRSPLAS